MEDGTVKAEGRLGTSAAEGFPTRGSSRLVSLLADIRDDF